MQPPQALANGASQEPNTQPTDEAIPLPAVLTLTLPPTAKRFSRVPSMFDSLGVEVPYPTLMEVKD